MILTGICVNHFDERYFMAGDVVDLRQPWLEVYVGVPDRGEDVKEVLTGLLPLALEDLQDFPHLNPIRKMFITKNMIFFPQNFLNIKFEYCTLVPPCGDITECIALGPLKSEMFVVSNLFCPGDSLLHDVSVFLAEETTG